MTDVDPAKLEAFVHRMVGDMGAALSTVLVSVGDRLGLFTALAQSGAVTPAELAEQTGTQPRNVREWLSAMAAADYVSYDAASGRLTLPPEHAAVLADPGSPWFLVGGHESISAVARREEAIVEAFKTGAGLGWGDHDPSLFSGVSRFFKPSYQHMLAQAWLPALEGTHDRLSAGGRVADIGCGHGASTRIMAEAYPQASCVGYDIHPPSVARATELAEEAGLENVRFQVAEGKSLGEGETFDLVTTFDCLHDMGDPVGVARTIRDHLTDDGCWMLVEPFAHDTLEANLNPVGRVYYGFSATVCTLCAQSQDGDLCLGAQAGEQRLREVVEAAGFTRFRRAAETPFNLILEARK